jgi:hypothetical protein
MVFLYMAPTWTKQIARGGTQAIRGALSQTTRVDPLSDLWPYDAICESFAFALVCGQRRSMERRMPQHHQRADTSDTTESDALEEHELPSIEALLAGTLALMTGYGQALQAALEPQHRLSMGVKVGSNLALLVDHPQLSLGFRQVLSGLQGRWEAMSRCTEEAARDVQSGIMPSAASANYCFTASKRLQ